MTLGGQTSIRMDDLQGHSLAISFTLRQLQKLRIPGVLFHR
jgi:hypothetical protein